MTIHSHEVSIKVAIYIGKHCICILKQIPSTDGNILQTCMLVCPVITAFPP